jgi:replicative DNA helicase
LVKKERVDDVIDILSPEAFIKRHTNIFFEAIVQLFTETQPIDLLTISTIKENAN